MAEGDAKKKMYHSPAVQTPTISELKDHCRTLGFKIPDEDLPDYRAEIAKSLDMYTKLEEYPEPMLPVNYPRTSGYKPKQEHNPYNAWVWRCDIQGSDTGKLAGFKVAIKDNIPVAGQPLTNGSKLLRGYTANFDATVVTRILDAGGHIVGMSACEDLCYSGASFTNAHGPTLNPFDVTTIAGGSSGGSGALLAAREVDLALGCDQGGSIRIPAAYCGVVGLKPTWGLVPYTGICSIEPTIDHVGPMARTVKECALMLEVLAGYDNGLDARQTRDMDVKKSYSKLTDSYIKSLKIGIVKEGFENCELDVRDGVNKAISTLTSKYKANVDRISVPEHSVALSLWSAVCNHGFYKTVVESQGCMTGAKAFYPTSLMDTFGANFAAYPNHINPVIKLILLTQHAINESNHNHFYAKAQNILPTIMKKYEEIFEKYDVLVMPTLPNVAGKIPSADSSLTDRVTAAFNMVQNTAPYDITGHPAITVPVQHFMRSSGQPVGLMIVGPLFGEEKVINVAAAIERITPPLSS